MQTVIKNTASVRGHFCPGSRSEVGIRCIAPCRFLVVHKSSILRTAPSAKNHKTSVNNSLLIKKKASFRCYGNVWRLVCKWIFWLKCPFCREILSYLSFLDVHIFTALAQRDIFGHKWANKLNKLNNPSVVKHVYFFRRVLFYEFVHRNAQIQLCARLFVQVQHIHVYLKKNNMQWKPLERWTGRWQITQELGLRIWG